MATQTTVVEVDIQGTERVESMRTQMRKLREELARLPEGTKEFQKVQRELGALTDKMGDLSKSVNTLSGDPLERLNNSFSMIGSSIMSLDFGQAQTGLQGMATAVKDFKVKDATTALKGFSSTIFDLGKALLLNPLFLIPALVIGIITNLDRLTSMGGKIGEFFGAIKKQIDAVWNSVMAFLDSTGIIDSKAEERKKKAEKDAKEAEAKLKKDNEKAKHEAEKLQHEKDRIAQEAAKKEAERMQKVRDDQKSLTEFLKGENEKRYQDSLANDDKLVRQAQLQYEEKKRLAHGNTQLLKQLEEEYQRQVAQIRDEETLKIQSRDAVKLQSAITTSEGIIFAISQEQRNSIESNQKRLEGEKAFQEAKINIVSDSISILENLNSALVDSGLMDAKKGFQIAKTLGIAQATISTIEGTQNAFKTAQASPITTVFPAYPFIQAGIAASAGIARIASIRAQRFNGGGNAPKPSASGGGGSMGSSSSAPAVDLSFLNQGSNKAQPIQTYVLATNVSSAQEAEQKIKDQSKIIK
jgi:hypothetical protein